MQKRFGFTRLKYRTLDVGTFDFEVENIFGIRYIGFNKVFGTVAESEKIGLRGFGQSLNMTREQWPHDAANKRQRHEHVWE